MGLFRGFKTKANRIAVGLRSQMGLPAAAPINLDDLAMRLGLPVVPIKLFADVCPEHVTQLTKTDKGAFSASLLRLDNGSRIILLNNGHSIGRRNSDLAHEISHALLAHPPTRPFDHTGCRNFDKDMEDEANCLAGHILIPNEAARKIVWSDHDPETVCDEYGVSRRMLNFRLDTSGARKRRSRWQQRRSIQTGAP